MTPSDRRTARQRQRKIDQAIEVLKQHPGFALAQVQAHDRGAELTKNLSPQQIAFGTPERMDLALQILNIQAEEYLALVVDMKFQEAYMVMLEAFGRKAFENFTGFPLEIVKSMVGNELQVIQRRVSHWVNEGYKRLIPPDALPDQTERQRIDNFIAAVLATGTKITRTDIWVVAGYSDPTEFERFQRSDKKTTESGKANFNRVLSMTPEAFLVILKKQAQK